MNDNPMNPAGIEAGDVVRLKEPRQYYAGSMKVLSVSGSHANKVYCKEIGHELFATCFEIVTKGKK